MMPNLDPRALKSMMAKMGMKSSEIDAERVVIYCTDREIVIEQPQVTQIEMQGNTSFQIAGEVSEREAEVKFEISEDDIKLVMEKTGADRERAETALKDAKGDLAAAIVELGG